MMGTAHLAFAATTVLFGFGMFLWGTLVERGMNTERMTEEWLNGFREGWEAAEQFDNDVRLVWGGR
jgi:hypothetical protein